jgi:hypothetical protein
VISGKNKKFKKFKKFKKIPNFSNFPKNSKFSTKTLARNFHGKTAVRYFRDSQLSVCAGAIKRRSAHAKRARTRERISLTLMVRQDGLPAEN